MILKKKYKQVTYNKFNTNKIILITIKNRTRMTQRLHKNFFTTI